LNSARLLNKLAEASNLTSYTRKTFMLPLNLDLARLRLALIGNGAAAARRLAWLDEAGAAALVVFAAEPSADLARAARERLERRWPSRADLAGMHLVFVADPDEPQRDALAECARKAGAIVHVEDEPRLTDIHAPAVLRRGDLTIAVSTQGASPGAAVEIREFLGRIFGPEWHGRIDQMRMLRQRWRRAGVSHELVRHLTASQLARFGWLKKNARAANDRSNAITTEEVDHVSETR
jgi:precorrin-2 dehydrogenase / sirohydrochlorin ferrochelatase